MHVVAIRRDVLAAHPWVARSLYRTFEEARRRSTARALDWSAPRFPVLWVAEHAARARALFGEDFWPCGVDASRPTLEAFLRFASEQGVAHRPLALDGLFPPEVRSMFRV